MMYIFIKGLQRLSEKSKLILVFLIYPSLNFSQVYNVENEEDISRFVLDNEYIVISKFKLDSVNFISTLGGYYQLNEVVYEIKNKDLYHPGLSSKGKPINEVWSIRDNK